MTAESLGDFRDFAGTRRISPTGPVIRRLGRLPSPQAESIGIVGVSFMIRAAAMEAEEEQVAGEAPGLRRDLAVLMKVRLNSFVLVTTFAGFFLASRGAAFDAWKLFHVLLGTAAAAFGASAFNQLMEIGPDARMKRTSDRPLPARRIGVQTAFCLAWILSAAGIIHLAAKAGILPAHLAAATIAVYVFVYTPLKRTSALNTLVGAVPGAIPPLIGWTGAGGALGWEAAFLFGLMFLWQLPHFVAINWLYRTEYEEAGYRMWSNGDESGKRSGRIAALWALALAGVSVLPVALGNTGWVWGISGPLLALGMAGLGLRLSIDGQRGTARRLFLSTLLYLPVALTILAFSWRNHP